MYIFSSSGRDDLFWGGKMKKIYYFFIVVQLLMGWGGEAVSEEIKEIYLIGAQLKETPEGSLVITSVTQGAPAQSVGLQPGDKIVGVNGARITSGSPSSYANMLLALQDKFKETVFDVVIAGNRKISIKIKGKSFPVSRENEVISFIVGCRHYISRDNIEYCKKLQNYIANVKADDGNLFFFKKLNSLRNAKYG